MFIFHPIPTISIPKEDIWNKHAKEVLCYNVEGERGSSSRGKFLCNPTADFVVDPDVDFIGGSFSVQAFAYPLAKQIPRLMEHYFSCNLRLLNGASNIQMF